MRLTSIATKNYRTLVDFEVKFSETYCTISGHNNAGKSCLIRLIQLLLEGESDYRYAPDEHSFNYDDDLTQWLKEKPEIKIQYKLLANRGDDAALVSFVERLTKTDLGKNEIDFRITITIDSKNNKKKEVYVNNNKADNVAATEIIKKLQNSETIFVYNSTRRQDQLYYLGGKFRSVFQVVLSPEDKESISAAEKTLQRKVKNLAKTHKGELNQLLGRLRQKYDVQFSTLDSFAAKRMPLGIVLKDKAVEVPLGDWGSGTQNQTQILLAILQANRIKTKEKPEDRITPIVLIEEPESFLHPHAQAEFGKILQSISDELCIQIITATHSPFMLNQVDTSANILLERRLAYGKAMETTIVPTDKEQWMAPFAGQLGILPADFQPWKALFDQPKQSVLLVEGPTDREYFLHLKSICTEFDLGKDVEIVPYEGKDNLKHTALIKFLFQKADRIFVTFDLDGAASASKSLEQIGLKLNTHFCPVGLKKPGRMAIEGLLPDRVLATVNGRETDLIMQSFSAQSDERRAAKGALKKLYLEEFKQQTDYSDDELKHLKALGKIIRRNFAERRVRHNTPSRKRRTAGM